MSRLSVIRNALLAKRVVTAPCVTTAFPTREKSSVAGTDPGNSKESGILRSPFGSVKVPMVSLPEYIFNESKHLGDKPAVTCGVSSRSYTYSQLSELTERFAWALTSDLKLNKGDVIGLLLPNIPEYAIAIHGGISAGLVVTFANPLYTAGEIGRQFKDAGVRCCVTVPQLLTVVKEVASQLPCYTSTIVIGQEKHEPKQLSFKQLLQEAKPTKLPSLNPHDVAVLPYSSGTTGLPKGVMLTHYNLVSNLVMMSHPDIVDHIPTSDTHQETSLTVLPFFHIYGFNSILNSNMVWGFQQVSLPRFAPDDYIRCLEKFRPTMLFVVPSLLLFLATHSDVTPDHLSSINEVLSGAAPATKSLLNKFKEKVGRDIRIRQGYGMTESSPVTLFPPCQMPASKLCSVGQLPPLTEAKVVDSETGQPLGAHQQGELHVRGPQVMVGYLNNPTATKETIDEDGWLHTGDVVYYDEDEYFFIVDRTKELIKVKGNQVSPTELENIILELPGVADVAVVGIPDSMADEIPRAFVVLRQNAKITEQQIIDHVKMKVVKYKNLAGGVRFLESIPRNPSGKILRQKLKAIK